MEVSFEGVKVLLIGDFVADRFVYTRPIRLSREAPVLVVGYEREVLSPGACGNTAMNLLSLGVELFPVTVLGDDEEGRELLKFFGGRCCVDGIVLDPSVRTVTKTRILSGDYHTSKQQILRIDRECQNLPSGSSVEKILETIERFSKECDVVVVSDYGYYTVRGKVLSKILSLSGSTKVVVDSRYSLRAFSGVYAATPNEAEAKALAGYGLEDVDSLTLFLKTKEILSTEVLLLTRGNKGMMVNVGDVVYTIPISGTDEVVDVTGAGDTVCAVFSSAVAKGLSPLDAALVANYAAGVVVLKKGTATATPSEIEEQMRNFPVRPERVYG